MRNTNHTIHSATLNDLIPTIQARTKDIPSNAASLEFYFNNPDGTICFKFFFGEVGKVSSWSYKGNANGNENFKSFEIKEVIFLHELVELIKSDLENFITDFERMKEAKE